MQSSSLLLRWVGRGVVVSRRIPGASEASQTSLLPSALCVAVRRKGDFGFNIFHNSNPQHGAAYGRHERKMSDDEFEDFLLSVKGWDHDSDTQSIWRSFYFDSFDDAYMFMGRLYAFCYGTDKYPHITWHDKRIDIHLYSPSFKGLSKREARLAAFCNDQLNMLKKGKVQRAKVMELAKDSAVHATVGADVAEALLARERSNTTALPEKARGTRTWKNLLS